LELHQKVLVFECNAASEERHSTAVEITLSYK